jgi:serine/threonine protein kinase
MSAVYKATDPNLKRVVAIKMVHSHLATDPKFMTRFEEEAAAVAKLRHPNIVQVFDFNNDDNVYYMVLEFIPGETLQQRLSQLAKSGRKLPIADAIRFTINICDAMGYAHKQGVIHRDIKPANIMLDVRGQAILMDFGIVKIVGGDSHTATGAVVGTARYMSPEAIRSEVTDQRSDIYSLGITLYEMLSGEPPFNADSAMSLMMMHLNDPIPDLRSFRPDVPPALVNILYKALEKNPDRRFNSAEEMASELKRVLVELEKKKVGEETAMANTDHPTMTQVRDESLRTNSTLPEAQERSLTPVQMRTGQSAAAPAHNSMDGKTIAAMSGPQSVIATGSSSTPQSKSAAPNSRLLLLLGGGVVMFILIGIFVVGFFVLSNLFKTDKPALPSSTPEPTQTLVSSTLPVIIENVSTETLMPTETPVPTETLTPTSTFPPLYVQILGITINSSNYYVVEYETYGYTEVLPGMHVHFFFNTVPPEQAGVPGKGQWYLYGGPRPFAGYSINDKPSGATQMCALVANANHTIILGSGNCSDLP